MAEELDWELEAFDKAFEEVLSKGMVKADFKARLVWLPKSLKYNKPESPNVVRSWRTEIDLLPECELKIEALAEIRKFLESQGPSYVQAFDEVTSERQIKGFGKPSVKPLPKTTPNQEQEQEQEQLKINSDTNYNSDNSPRDAREKNLSSSSPPKIERTELQARAVQIAVLLRERGARLQHADPNVQGWAKEGYSDAHLLVALEQAQAQRADKGDPTPVNSGYLDAILQSNRASRSRPRARDRPPNQADRRAAFADQIFSGLNLPGGSGHEPSTIDQID